MEKSFSNEFRGEVLANQHFSPADLKTLNHQAVIHYGKRESRWFTSFTPLPDKMSFCQPSRYAVEGDVAPLIPPNSAEDCRVKIAVHE